jgi:hypothetical protein
VHTHTLTHSLTHTHTYIHMRSCFNGVQVFLYIYIYNIYLFSSWNIQIMPHMQKHSDTDIHTQPHILRCMTHKCMHAHLKAYTHTHTRTHTVSMLIPVSCRQSVISANYGLAAAYWYKHTDTYSKTCTYLYKSARARTHTRTHDHTHTHTQAIASTNTHSRSNT